MSQNKEKVSIKTKLLTDVSVGAITLALLSPVLTGLAIHEWLGIGVAVMVVAHVLFSWQWIAATTLRFLRGQSWLMRFKYILDAVFFITMTLVIYSGLLISRVALPTFGLSVAPGFFWRSLHIQSSNLLLPIMGLHLALNWGWVVSNLRRYVVQPVKGLFSHRTPAPTGDLASKKLSIGD
jgi:hypothetical protein